MAQPLAKHDAHLYAGPLRRFSTRTFWTFALAVALLGGAGWADAQTTVSVPAETLVTTTSFTYHDSGRLRTETVEPDGVNRLKLETTYEYDTVFGNRTTAIARGWNGEVDQDRRTLTGWDATGRFPVTSTNARDHVETRQYDSRFGVVMQQTDINGVVNRWSYDGFGRKISELRSLSKVVTPPGPTNSNASDGYTEWRYENCADIPSGCPTIHGVAPVYVVTTMVWSSKQTPTTPMPLAPTTKVYHDRLNREIRTESAALVDGVVTPVYKDTVYDDRGQVLRASMPYFATASPQWTTYEYDDLGRKRMETASNGIRTETVITALQTTTIVHATEGDRTKVVKQNGLGHAIEVVDANSRSAFFIHDAHGNLTHAIDPYGNTVVTTYDVRGRKESMTDPDMGAWTYVHNSFGELFSQRDAKGQETIQRYDSLGRVIQRVEPDLRTDFVYDTAAKGVGKLAQSYTDNGYCRAHTYDTFGRPSETIVGIGGTSPCTAPTSASMTSSVHYDFAGRIEWVTYPTGLTVRNEYNPTLGFLERVHNFTGYSIGTVFWQWQANDALGRVTKFLNGNNVATLKVYGEQEPWLQSIFAGRGGNPALGDVQLAGYKYDSIGNLRERSDRFDIPNLVEKAGHDALGRLSWYALYDSSGATEVSGSRTSLTYDAIGNIKTKSDVGTYYYNASGGTSVRPHAVTEVRGAINASYAYYDANGNMTGGAGRAFAYTSFNMVREVGNNTGCQRFTYQGEHLRVQQLIYNTGCPYAGEGNVVGSTLYLHPDAANGLSFERETKGGSTNYKHYINAGGMVVGVLTTNTATVTSNAVGTMNYFHYDHLGSVVAVTDAAATLVERRSFDPWGKARRTDGVPGTGELPNGINAATDRGFTLHEHLEGLGLIHMNGRVYDFSLGRFVSPDPFVQEPGDLQSYNRYAYVRNRPLNSTDPTGYLEVELCLCAGSSSGSGLQVSWFGRWNGADPDSTGRSGGTVGNGVTYSLGGPRGDKSYNNWLPQESTMSLNEAIATDPKLASAMAKRLTAGGVASQLWNSSDNWIGLTRNVVTSAGTTAWNLLNFVGAGVAGDSQWAADSVDALLNRDRGASVSTAMLAVGGLAGARTVRGPADPTTMSGSGPAPGLLEVSSRYQSSSAVRNFQSAKPVDFVFDAKTGRFVVGTNVVIGREGAMMRMNRGHPETATQAGMALDSQVVGGHIRFHKGQLMTSEWSGRLGQNWTPAIRAQYLQHLERYGVSVRHFEGFPW
jgi:RHS repeat-associated protein